MRSLRAGVGAPVDVLVHMGDDWLAGTAHAVRDSRHGRQILIGHHGHLTWIAAHRVRPLDADADTEPAHPGAAGAPVPRLNPPPPA